MDTQKEPERLTYGEAVTRLCQLRDELKATEYGRFILAQVMMGVIRISAKGGKRE